MDPIVLSLNHILNQWKQQFDIFSAISSEFSVEDGSICFEHYPLCHAGNGLVLISSEYDSESIQFYFSQNRSIRVAIDWPEDQPPVVSSVSFVYMLTESHQYEQVN